VGSRLRPRRQCSPQCLIAPARRARVLCPRPCVLAQGYTGPCGQPGRRPNAHPIDADLCQHELCHPPIYSRERIQQFRRVGKRIIGFSTTIQMQDMVIGVVCQPLCCWTGSVHRLSPLLRDTSSGHKEDSMEQTSAKRDLPSPRLGASCRPHRTGGMVSGHGGVRWSTSSPSERRSGRNPGTPNGSPFGVRNRPVVRNSRWRLVKKLKRIISPELMPSLLPTPLLAFHLGLLHTHHQQAATRGMG
jgi:hypothetical protein